MEFGSNSDTINNTTVKVVDTLQTGDGSATWWLSSTLTNEQNGTVGAGANPAASGRESPKSKS